MYYSQFAYLKNNFCIYRVSELLDYTADDLTGQSLYALCHGEDVHKMKKTHEDCKLILFLTFMYS